jgi:hypothetical protein
MGEIAEYEMLNFFFCARLVSISKLPIRRLGSARFSNQPCGRSANFGTVLLEVGANTADGLEQL